MGLLGVCTAVLAIATAPVVAASSRQDVIDLPLGWGPEGITLGEGWTVFSGSYESATDAGSIWQGDLSTGKGEIVIEEPGKAAVGLHYDRRSGYLFVCGGFSGTGRIYDMLDYTLVKEFNLAGTGVNSLINDVILTKTGAYSTDSFQPYLYSVPLDRDTGELRNGADTVSVPVPLGPDFTMIANDTNANGIEVTGDDETLIVVNIAAGELYTVDPVLGGATKIDLGGALVHGDGLVRRQNTLWAVESPAVTGNKTQITEVSLSADLTCGSVLPRALKSDFFDYPSTTLRKGNSLYTVQARFDVSTEDISTTTYQIVRTDRDSGEVVCSAA